MIAGRGFVAVGAGDLRRLGPAARRSSGPTSSAAPIALQLELQAQGCERLPLPPRGPPVPRRHRRAGRCSAVAGGTPHPRRSTGLRGAAADALARPRRSTRPSNLQPPAHTGTSPMSIPHPDPVRSSPGAAVRRPWPHRRRRGRRPCSAQHCSSDDSTTASSDGSAGGWRAPTVGFIYVGPKDDFGYNQAAYEGSLAIEEAYPDVEVLQAENVPETAEADAGHGGHDRPGRRRSSSPPATATSSSPRTSPRSTPT